MSFRLRFIYILVVSAVLVSCSNKVISYSEETSVLVEQIRRDNYIGTAVVGKGGGPSAAYERRRLLMDSASQEELENLVRDKNPVLSLTAFQALCEKGDPKIPTYLSSIYAKEEVQVHVIQGDISTEMSSLEYAYSYILGLPLAGETTSATALVDYPISAELQSELSKKITEFTSSNKELK